MPATPSHALLTPPADRRKFLVIITTLLLFAIALAAFGDVPLLRQLHTASYPSTPGILDRTTRTRVSDDYSTRIQMDYLYHYTVNATTYTGTRLAFTISNTSPASFAALAPNAPITVYYNPADPADSLLDNQTRPADWALAYFFSAIAALLCFLAINTAHGLRASRLQVLHNGPLTRMRFNPSIPAGFFLAAGLACLAATAIETACYFAHTASPGPLDLLLPLIAAPLTAIIRARCLTRGDYDFLLNRDAAALTTPSGHILPLSDITALSVRSPINKSSGLEVLCCLRSSPDTPLLLRRFHFAPANANLLANTLRSLLPELPGPPAPAPAAPPLPRTTPRFKHRYGFLIALPFMLLNGVLAAIYVDILLFRALPNPTPMDWLAAYLLTPALFLPLFWARRTWQRFGRSGPTPSIQILDRGTFVRIRPAPMDTILNYAGVAAFLGFLLAAVLEIPAILHDTFHLGPVALLIPAIAALLAAAARATFLSSGKSDFRIDRTAATLTTPSRRSIPLADIRDVSIAASTRDTQTSGPTLTDHVQLLLRSTPETPIRVKTFTDWPEQAQALADTLRPLLLTAPQTRPEIAPPLR